MENDLQIKYKTNKGRNNKKNALTGTNQSKKMSRN